MPPPSYPSGAPYPPVYPPSYAPPGYPPGPPPPMPSGYYTPYPYSPYGWPPPTAVSPLPAEPVKRVERYWLPIVILDVISTGMMVGGVIGDSKTAIKTGGIAYLFAPPVVHFANGNIGKGFGSFGIRLGAIYTAVGGAALLSQGGCDERLICPGPLIVMGLLSFGGATVIDSLVLAKKTVVEKPGAITVAPTVTRQQGATVFGLVGAW